MARLYPQPFHTVRNFRRILSTPLSKAGLLVLASALALPITGCKDADPTGKESLKKAEKFFAAGDYGSAEVEYKNTLSANPRETTALLRMAQIWHERGGPFQAAVMYRNVMNLDPSNAKARLGMAEFLLSIGDRSSARKEALEVLKTKPTHPDALLLLAKVSSNEQEMKEAEAKMLFPEAEGDAKIWQAKAILAMARGDADAADQAIGKSIELDGKDPRAHFLKARLLLARKDAAAAEEHLKTAVELAPLRSQERITYAMYLLSAGRHAEAVPLLEAATEKAPDFIAAWRMLARVALSANDHEKARNFLQKVYSWDATDFESNVLMAMLHLSEKDGEGRGEAIEVLEKLRTSHPPNALVEYYLGRARLSEGKTEQAVEALTRALRVEPEMRDALILLAGIRLEERRYDDIVSLLEPYLRNHTGDIDAILLYSEACRLSRNLQKSWSAMSAITQEPDDNVRWHLQKALVLKDLGKTAEARSAFEKVESLDPSNKRAASELVALDSIAGNHAAALERAEQQLKLHPDDASLFYMRASILVNLSRQEEAMNDLRKALQLDSKLVAAHLMISKMLSAAGKPDEALQQLEQARAESPGNPAVLLSLIAIHDAAGRKAEVRNCYEEILKDNPKYVPALNNLAMMLGESSEEDLEKAYQLAQEAATLSPDVPVISDTLGWILYKKAEFKRAHRYLTEAADKIKDDAMIQFHHGMACLAMGDEKAAGAAFRAALAADPAFARKAEAEKFIASLGAPAADESWIQQHPLDMVSRLKLGGALEAAGKFPEAAAVFEAALAVNADLFPAASRLAHLNIGPLNDPDKAYKFARQAAELSPQDAAIRVILARLAFRDGEYERADVLFQNSLADIKGDTGLMAQAAWAAYSVGRVDDATKLMQSVVSGSKDDAVRADAKLFLDLLNPSPPADLVEKTLAKDPRHVPALMARADLAAKKDPEGALKDYEAVLEIYPKFRPAGEAADKIRAAEEKE